MSFARNLAAAPGPGFLGLTSSSVEYVGAQKQHGIVDVEDNEDDNPTHSSLENGDLPDYLEDQIDAGAAILSHLQDFPLLEYLVCEWRSAIFGSSVFLTWIDYVSDSIKTLLYEPMHSLNKAGNGSVPHKLSRWLFHNSLHPFKFNGHCTVKQFAALFTGEGLRWQAVGIFFTAASIATITRGETSPALGSIGGMNSRRRSVFARRLLEVGQTCLNFCEKIGHLTDPEIWLAFEIAHVSSVVEGDAGRFGFGSPFKVLTVFQATRLIDEQAMQSPHVLQWACILTKKPPTNCRFGSRKYGKGRWKRLAGVPLLLVAECTYRVFVILYNFDKTVSTILGRPPRLCRRYCSMQLPLDLDQNCLELPLEQMEEVVNRLDADGWNTEGSIRGAARPRALFICNMIREDILELSLAAVPHKDVTFSQ